MQVARLIVASLAVLFIGGCASNQESDSDPGMAAPPSFPHNKLLSKAFPNFRLDCFYNTEIDRNGQMETLKDRLISNGRGFVAYSTDFRFVVSGYYLFNFYGNTSYFISVPERTYKVALTSPADDILRAYQDCRDKSMEAVRKDLGEAKIGDHECHGFSYKEAGFSREDWFDRNNFALVSQKVVRPGEVITRKLERFNDFCETTLLRLPSGFNFVKSSQEQK